MTTTGVSAQNLIKPAPVQPTKILTPTDITNNLLQIPSMLETGENEVEHAIVYGGPGTGKTTLAALLSEFFHILWLDGDKGLSAVQNNLPPELRSRIHPIRIPDNTSSPKFAPTVLKIVTGLRVEICVEHGTHDCSLCKGRNDKPKYPTFAINQLPKDWIVICDSMTQYFASARALAQYKLNQAAVKAGELDVLYKGDYDYWGICWNYSDMLGNYVKDLLCQFVMISHETMAKAADSKEKLVPIGGTKTVSAGHAKWYSTEVYSEVINNKIVFHSSVTSKPGVQTKSRSNVFLETAETPSLLHVFRPGEAEEILKGSFNEWYLQEGWKNPKDRKKKDGPKPKEILPL